MIHASGRPSADLLPWADPYILQLFAEAERQRAEEDSRGIRLTRTRVTPGGEASAEAVFAEDGWRVTARRPSGAARRQRTESARQLAAC